MHLAEGSVSPCLCVLTAAQQDEGKTLSSTTNCTKKEAFADIICSCPWFPLNVAPAAQTALLVIQLCLCQVYGRRSSVCGVDWKSQKAGSLWQPVNHYLYGGMPGAVLLHTANIDGSNCCVLLVCPHRAFCHFAHNLLLSNFYFSFSFCLLAPVALENLLLDCSTQFKPHTFTPDNSAASSSTPWTIPIHYYQSLLANCKPMTPLSLQKQTKREGMEGWREVEGRDPACN